MALSGIDAQIMIQRTTDYSKDAGNAMRRNELMQEYASEMRKAEDEARLKTVERRDGPEGAAIGREKNGSGRGAPEEEGENRGKEREKPGDQEGPDEERGSFIDIMV